MIYIYKCLNKFGEIKEGVVTVDDIEQARKILAKEYKEIIEIKKYNPDMAEVKVRTDTEKKRIDRLCDVFLINASRVCFMWVLGAIPNKEEQCKQLVELSEKMMDVEASAFDLKLSYLHEGAILLTDIKDAIVTS